MAEIGADDILNVVNRFYEAGMGDGEWPDALESLRKSFHGSRACLVRQGPGLGASDVKSTAVDPRFIELFVEQYAGDAALFDTFDDAPIGAVIADDQLTDSAALERTPFWNNWMRPQDLYSGLGCKLDASASSYWYLDVRRGRTQARFEAAERKAMAQIVPHSLRAMRISRDRAMTRALLANTGPQDSGVIVVDPAMIAISINETAKALLGASNPPLALRGGKVVAACASDGPVLHNLIKAATSPPTHRGPPLATTALLSAMSASPHDRRFVVTAAALHDRTSRKLEIAPCVVLHIRDMALPLSADFQAQIRAVFSLTAGEARLAASLASGMTVINAAAKFGVGVRTARNCLSRIFRKTETQQQGQLIALLRSLRS